MHINDACRTDLQTREEFIFEVKRWKLSWELHPTHQVKSFHLCEILELVNKTLYTNIYCILNILLTIPPSIVSAKRSFRVLKRVKTYLRAIMGKERLTALALLHIHRDIQLPLDKFNNARQINTGFFV